MKVQDNIDIQIEIDKLVNKVSNVYNRIEDLKRLVDSNTGEVDTVEEVEKFDKEIFDLRALMFNTKIELEKIQKNVHKHVAHTLNPIPKTAPKSAKKRKDAVSLNPNLLKSIDNVFNEPPVVLQELERRIKEKEEPVKHSTISRNKKSTGTIPIKPKSNEYNPHEDDRGFE